MTEPATVPRPTALSLPVVETFHSLQGEGLHAGRSAFFLRLAGCDVGCPWCDTKHSWPIGAHGQRSLEELAQEAGRAAAAGAGFMVITGGEPLHHDLAPLCARLRATTSTHERPRGLPLHLETSGVDPLSGPFDWISLSPKRHRPPRPELLAACHELKVVVHEPSDLAFAEAMAAQALAARQAESSGQGDCAREADLIREADTGLEADPGQEADGDQVSLVVQPLEPAPPATVPATGAEPAARVPVPAAGAPGPALLLQPGWNCPRGQELAIAFVRSHPAWRLSLQSHKWLGVR